MTETGLMTGWVLSQVYFSSYFNYFVSILQNTCLLQIFCFRSTTLCAFLLMPHYDANCISFVETLYYSVLLYMAGYDLALPNFGPLPVASNWIGLFWGHTLTLQRIELFMALIFTSVSSSRSNIPLNIICQQNAATVPFVDDR